MDILHYGEKSVSVAMKKSNPRIGWRKCISPRSRVTWAGSTRSPDTMRMTCDSSRITGHGGSRYENTRRYTHRAFVFRGRFRTGPGTSRGRVWRCPDFVTPGFAIG